MIEIYPAGIEEKPLIARMMQLYLYDFSEFTGDDLDAEGLYDPGYLDRYWEEYGRYPFLIRVQGKLAGFVLVNSHQVLPGSGHSIAEFFVMKKYRRQGVGRLAAFRIFDRFEGKWEVHEIPENLPAQAFWRLIIDEYTDGKFEDTYNRSEGWIGPIQSFQSGKKP